MTREEALRVFQQEHSQLLEQCQQRSVLKPAHLLNLCLLNLLTNPV